MPLRFQPARGASVLISSSSRGPTGSAATIAVGSTTTAAAGTSASVSNSGSSSAATFNFTVPRGADAGIKWLYDSSTTMADPGSGDIRFNNATLSSVTAIAVSKTGSGSDVSDYVASWDDSTNTTKAHIVIREEAGSVAAVFSLSAVTDNTDWLQLTVAYVSGSLSLTDADPLYVVPMLIGNKGSDGQVAGPGVSVDSEIALWNGTDGATLKRASTTGILKATSGVIAAAVSGTDYAPATSGTSILKGNGSGGFSNASAGTDYQAADAELSAIAGLTSAADKLPYFTGSGTAALADFGSFGRSLVDDANAAAGLATLTARGQGRETIWIPASAMWARTTNGPGAASRELTTGGDVMIKGWAFDTTTEEGVQFYIAFPKSWNKGTVTFQVWWTNASGASTETVSWGLSAGAYTNDDPIDTTDFGTEVRVSDTWLAQNDMHVTSESSAVTIGNTPIDDDMIIGQIVRSVSNDNMTGDAELLGIKIFFTTNAATDA